MTKQSTDVVVVGAGIAGLYAAKRAAQNGKSVVVFESQERVGGRIWSDVVGGYTIDRGFQVLPTAYREARKAIDFTKLGLRYFDAGALVWDGARIHTFRDPTRHMGSILQSIRLPWINFNDWFLLGKLRWLLLWGYKFPQTSTREFLSRFGFSESFMDRFFTPFLRGIFLERDLQTSSEMFLRVFQTFASGRAALPEGGMKSIPLSLLQELPYDTVQLQRTVVGVALQPDGTYEVELSRGERWRASRVLMSGQGALQNLRWNSTLTFYFGVKEPPFQERLLFLNGSGHGFINDLSVLSLVQPSYAPVGKHLVSVSVIGERWSEAIECAVREELKNYFGERTSSWEKLTHREIKEALPLFLPQREEGSGEVYPQFDGVTLIGDVVRYPSTEGACESCVV